jgi:acetolactate synthase-1/2/3 large subunit
VTRSRRRKPGVDRRDFLKGAAGATLVAAPAAAAGQRLPATSRPVVVRPTQAAARAEFHPPEGLGAAPTDRQPASDFMVDVLRALDLDYCAVNPGSSFQGLHESIVSSGTNRKPELLTVLHEESGAAIAHGYAKAAGKPMMVLLHGTVGLLHASMAVFQAWADRVPLFAVVAHNRNPVGPINRPHSAQDMGALVRDFVKWDDEPSTLDRFAQAAMRGYAIGLSPPRGPTLLVVDAALQELPIDRAALRMPVLVKPTVPQGDPNAVREAARMLIEAERPLICPLKMARTPAGWDCLLELAEFLQAPVDPGGYGSWQDFPSWHDLRGSGGPDYRPDLVLGLENNDVTGLAQAARANGGRSISICSEYLFQGANIHDFGDYAEVDLAIAADAEATLPALTEEVRRLANGNRRRFFRTRGAQLATVHRSIRQERVRMARYGWNASPVSVPRMIAELAHQIRNDDWAIVSGHPFTGEWQRCLLNHERHYRYNGDSGAFGIGYDTPASIGGALAHMPHGRLAVGIVGDGDFNFVGAGALWTAAHHRIPVLIVVHNNRAYHATMMTVQRIAGRRGRAGMARAHIGNVISDPAPDYAMIARGYGVYAEGPVARPDDLGPAFKRALARVRAGEPALVDVVSQPR